VRDEISVDLFLLDQELQVNFSVLFTFPYAGCWGGTIFPVPIPKAGRSFSVISNFLVIGSLIEVTYILRTRTFHLILYMFFLFPPHCRMILGAGAVFWDTLIHYNIILLNWNKIWYWVGWGICAVGATCCDHCMWMRLGYLFYILLVTTFLFYLSKATSTLFQFLMTTDLPTYLNLLCRIDYLTP